MLKNIIGDWGADLDDDDYARALAALGVLESQSPPHHRQSSDPAVLRQALEAKLVFGERTRVWRSVQNVNPMKTVESWRQTLYTDAPALAAAWQQYLATIKHHRQQPRLAINLNWRDRPDLFDFDELCAWLNHYAVGLDALLLTDRPGDHMSVSWHWPVRIGVPLGSEDLLGDLKAAQRRHSWGEKLSQCYSVGSGRDTCDVLILTSAAIAKILSQSRTRIRTNFVVCLDDPPVVHSQIDHTYVELRDRLHAVGLAVTGHVADSQRLSDWFTLLMIHLSHDLPIHAAIRDAGRSTLNCNPVILGIPSGIDQCRILGLAKRLDSVATSLAASQQPPGTTWRSGGVSFGRPGESKGALALSLRKRLADDLRSRRFTSEGVDGVDTVDVLSRREDDLELARVPRWIHADAWRTDDSESPARSLAPGKWNFLTVRIGPSEQRRDDAAFPDREIDFTAGIVAVTVQLELHGAALSDMKDAGLNAISSNDMAMLMRDVLPLLPQPPVSENDSMILGLASNEIILPAVGDSSCAAFAVCPQDGVNEVKGRIAIVHNNRILQTARLSIVTDVDSEHGNGVSVVSDVAIHPRQDDLDDRREYDVAIQVSDVGGKLHLTVQHDETSTPVQLDDLAQPISSIRAALEQAAINWDYSKTVLEQDVFPDSLYALAANGSALDQHLRKKCGDEIDRWDRIHLVPATDEFLPLEYMYDGPPPKADATVCPNMLGALESGSCDKALKTPGGGAAPCANQRDSSFLCPMHFWGFRKLIERSGTIQPPEVATAEVEPLAQITVPSKQAYGKVHGMLFGASNRAFLYAADSQTREAERAALLNTLTAISAAVSEAADWDQWRQGAKNQPNLLVLVVHSDQYRGAPALEIGDKKFLGYQEIKADLSCAAGKPQLLILLGCSVASVGENFQRYPERFRDAGVNIVLAPIATIRGADAVRIAKGMTQILSDRLARPEPTAFGELLPLLRRELLREGHAGVMGIVGFGDGDWLLGGV